MVEGRSLRRLSIPILIATAACGGCGDGASTSSGGADPFAKEPPTLPRVYDARSLAQWITIARTGSAPDRAAAAFAIGELLRAGAAADGAGDALLALLGDPSRDVRFAALTTLRRGEILPEATGALVEMANAEGSALAESALQALRSMEVRDEEGIWRAFDTPPVRKELYALLREGAPLDAKRSNLLWKQWSWGPRDTKAAALEIFALRGIDGRRRTATLLLDDAMETQRAAAHALRACKDGTELLPLLDHERSDVVYWATVALAGDAKQVDRLIELLARANPVRGAAINGLVAIGKPAVGALRKAAAQTENQDVAKAAAAALDRIDH